ncbi:hypothetical protein HD554DRAFT_2093317, partial [Boletus coccyginus]
IPSPPLFFLPLWFSRSLGLLSGLSVASRRGSGLSRQVVLGIELQGCCEGNFQFLTWLCVEFRVPRSSHSTISRL